MIKRVERLISSITFFLIIYKDRTTNFKQTLKTRTIFLGKKCNLPLINSVNCYFNPLNLKFDILVCQL